MLDSVPASALFLTMTDLVTNSIRYLQVCHHYRCEYIPPPDYAHTHNHGVCVYKHTMCMCARALARACVRACLVTEAESACVPTW